MTLTATQVTALRDLERTWPGRSFVIIGATALTFYYEMSWRKTADIDLVVAADLDEFPLGLETRAGWQRHHHLDHQFRSPDGVKLDILPAGPKLVAEGRILWSGGHEMTLTGMDLVFRHAVEHTMDGDLRLKVAPPHVIALLKMVAYLDRPHERLRDLTDLAHLFDGYVDDQSDRWFDEGLAAGEYDLVPAFLLAVDLAKIAEPPHREVVDRFLSRVGDPGQIPHSEMETRGPFRWTSQDAPLERRLSAFRRGWG